MNYPLPSLKSYCSPLPFLRILVPGYMAPQASRGASLCVWAEGPVGCGLDTLKETLDEVLSHHRWNASATPTTPVPDRTSRPSSNESFQEKLPNGVLLDMVYIPGGRFYMGSPESEVERKDTEGPQHRVKVPDFFMGKYPVTQAQWYAVALLDDVDRALNPNPSKFKGNDLPVEQVSWHDAIEFCKRLSNHTGQEYRLPSEADWEYACRAHTTTPFYFGETITTDQANYRGTDWKYKGTLYPGNYGNGPKGVFREKILPVGSFQPNAFGLFDMHGNVLEWCQDVWHDNYEGAPTNGNAWNVGGDSDLRVFRGGSWYDAPRYCRSAYRSWLSPDYVFDDLVSRVCCFPPRALF